MINNLWLEAKMYYSEKYLQEILHAPSIILLANKLVVSIGIIMSAYLSHLVLPITKALENHAVHKCCLWLGNLSWPYEKVVGICIMIEEIAEAYASYWSCFGLNSYDHQLWK